MAKFISKPISITLKLKGLNFIRSGRASQQIKTLWGNAHRQAHKTATKSIKTRLPTGKRPPTDRGKRHIKEAYFTDFSLLRYSLYAIDLMKAAHARAYYEGSAASVRRRKKEKGPMWIPLKWWNKGRAMAWRNRYIVKAAKRGPYKGHSRGQILEYPRNLQYVPLKMVRIPSRGSGKAPAFDSNEIIGRVTSIYLKEFDKVTDRIGATLIR